MMPVVTVIKVQETAGLRRVDTPLQIGVPVAKNVHHGENLCLDMGEGDYSPLQFTVLNRWPDGSSKWILLTAIIDVDAHSVLELPVLIGDFVSENKNRLVVDTTADGKIMIRGVDTWYTGQSGQSLLSCAGPVPVTVDLFCTSERNRSISFGAWNYVLEEVGELYCSLLATMSVEIDNACLSFKVRFKFFAGSALVHSEVLVHNPQAARHKGGLWDLGDEGSVRFKEIGLALAVAKSEVRSIFWEDQDDGQLYVGQKPLLIYQESSGGENWQSANHVDANNQLSVSYCGYRVLQGDEIQARGKRIQPAAGLQCQQGEVGLSIAHFWENFPSALCVDANIIKAGVFPARDAQVYELQGGEQKRHEIQFGIHKESVLPELKHQRLPVQVIVSPDLVEASGALSFFAPSDQDATDYRSYVDSLIVGANSFFAKAEQWDEFGWRNFGEAIADHEAVREKNPASFVSHYNNQYDLLHAAYMHFLKSGTAAWRELADQNAKHIIDIDIYHTKEDRWAYNGGMFWHTDHYVPAVTATHRTYSAANGEKNSSYGGGPSNEHCYTSGLLLHYFLTGDLEAKHSVLELADWVCAMDDGTKTGLALFDPRPTGLASKTLDNDYHGPGRGAGNAINALLDAYTLSGQYAYLTKAESLIRRCIHPHDDIGAIGLHDVEHRWSYLVFLQVLGKYLEHKICWSEYDYMFSYARASLLHYASWMFDNEMPYKDVLDKVELPTETWPAQDIRKAQIFGLAAQHAQGIELQQCFCDRARYYFARCIGDLNEFETAYLTRPQVLLANYGYSHAALTNAVPAPPCYPITHRDFGAPSEFQWQRKGLFQFLTSRFRQIFAEFWKLR
jgi:hypothetical protein